MIALDTNVLVRVLTNDDPIQARRALSRMRTDDCWVSRTVLLETAWVLRHGYDLDRAAVGRAFLTLLSVSTVDIEDRAAVVRALGWHAKGMDFADALHLSTSEGSVEFVTFDRALVKVATKVGATPAVGPP